MLVDLGSPDSAVIEEAARIIKDGGVVLYPSDTIYGLGCDPFNADAVKRVYEMKGRDEGKGVLLLIPGRAWVDRLAAEVLPVAEHLMGQFWPGPLTLLFPPSPSVPSSVVGREGKIGIRCPDSPFLKSWMESIQGPLVSTSANLSRKAIPKTLKTLRDIFYDKVDLFLEAGELAARPVSTVVDLLGVPRIVRRGAGNQEIEGVLARLRRE